MQHTRSLSRAALIASTLWLGAAAAALAAGTLDKAKDSGKLTLGYASDSRPYAYADAAGKPAGYAIELCNKVADAVKAELKLSALAVEVVALPRDEALRALDQGKVDLLCGAVPTLQGRTLADYSIPILISGASAAIRTDTAARIAQALAGRDPSGMATWRGSTDQAPQRAVLAVAGGAPLEKALGDALKERRIVAEVVPAKDTDAGLQMLSAHSADAVFGDRAMLLEAVARSGSSNVVVLDRLFRRYVVALGVRRADDDFKLLVDRTLSRLYRTPEQPALYAKHFGAPSPSVVEFFQLVAMPD